MRIGIIGLAGVGQLHLEIMPKMDEFEVVAVCDISEPVLAEKSRGRDLARYTDALAMMEEQDLDAVSLCTPPKVHALHAKMAAERGIHVLCEKPMATTPEQCQEMIDACRAAGVVLMVAHKKRFVSAVRRLKELSETQLGPIEVLMHRYPHPWMSEAEWFWDENDGGGPLLENAVHAADLVRYLLGDIERVFAEGDVFNARHRAPQLNTAVYTARSRRGAIAMVGAGMIGTPTPGLAFEDTYVACEHGTAQVTGDFDNPSRLVYALRTAPGAVSEEVFDQNDPFRAEFLHFAECVRDGAVPLTSGEESLKAVALCHAVKKSARTHQPVYLDAG